MFRNISILFKKKKANKVNNNRVKFFKRYFCLKDI